MFEKRSGVVRCRKQSGDFDLQPIVVAGSGKGRRALGTRDVAQRFEHFACAFIALQIVVLSHRSSVAAGMS